MDVASLKEIKTETASASTQPGGRSRLFTRLRGRVADHCVPLFFIVICLVCVYFSALPLSFILETLLDRIMRNSFLVLALVIPVIAGLGLNFGIVIGAMAAQFSMIAVSHWGIHGFPGLLICVGLTTPMALLFGTAVGNLMNKTKGQEMIAGMIAGFFSDGLYQFILLFLVGSLIPLHNPALVLSTGIGIRNTVDLSRNGGLKYSLDNLLRLPLFETAAVISVIALLIVGFMMIRARRDAKPSPRLRGCLTTSCAVLAAALLVIFSRDLHLFFGSLPLLQAFIAPLVPLATMRLPAATTAVICCLALFTVLILRTKLGQDFRSVGQDMHIAAVSGINVDRVRLVAVTLSIMLAAWGHLIFLQNIGTIATYGSHVQIALFSIAALLIGGASVTRATVGQAITGVILFHTLFIVSPKAGNNLFGDAQIGEFFRAFIAYGAIGLSLGLHAWRKAAEKKKKAAR